MTKYVEVGEGYAVGADDLNIILYKLTPIKEGKNAGGVRPSVIGYYPSVEAVLKRISNDKVMSCLQICTQFKEIASQLECFTDKMYASTQEVVKQLRQSV